MACLHQLGVGQFVPSSHGAHCPWLCSNTMMSHQIHLLGGEHAKCVIATGCRSARSENAARESCRLNEEQTVLIMIIFSLRANRAVPCLGTCDSHDDRLLRPTCSDLHKCSPRTAPPGARATSTCICQTCTSFTNKTDSMFSEQTTMLL